MTAARSFPVLLHLACPGFAQPASDLLQTAIFAEESSGDLANAIRIYQQILNAGPAMRLYAPQALYHLGVCLLHKNDVAGARRAFETLNRDYPEERELIARAHEIIPTDATLLPAPWADSEVSEYRWSIPGVDAGWSLSRIGPAKGSPRFRIQTNFYGPQLNAAMVDVERDTMITGPALYRGPGKNARTATAGVYHTAAPSEYPASAWSFSGKTGGKIYAQAELPYLLRRLMLEPGVPIRLVLLAPGSTTFSMLRASLDGTERVVVPAGAFDCWRIRLTPDPTAHAPAPAYSTMSVDFPMPADGETYWIARDGARPVVKIVFGPNQGELTSIRSGEIQGTTAYRDVATGFSLTIPAGWAYHARNAINAGGGSSVDLIDPDSQTVVIVSAKTVHTDSAWIRAALARGMEEKEAGMAGPRPAMNIHEVGGHLAGTLTLNTQAGRINYTTWIQSESTRASITFTSDSDVAPALLARLQPVLDSFRMP